jgi:MYXO-CTERM domain-containing protein
MERKEIRLKGSNLAAALILAGLMASPALLHAQSNPASSDERGTTALEGTQTVTDRDDHRNWGWLGLLGLGGLLGLKRRDREKRKDEVDVRQPRFG